MLLAVSTHQSIGNVESHRNAPHFRIRVKTPYAISQEDHEQRRPQRLGQISDADLGG